MKWEGDRISVSRKSSQGSNDRSMLKKKKRKAVAMVRVQHIIRPSYTDVEKWARIHCSQECDLV
jgi:hypothetical protein